MFFGLITLSNSVNAQIKEGAITYTMTIDGLPPEQAAMMEGMEMKTIFKNGKIRSEWNSAFGSSVTVTDGKGGYTTLMDQMGQKIFMKGKVDDAKKKEDKLKDPKINYVSETKSIAGYECKKAIIETETGKGESVKSTVWFTDKFAPIESGGGRGMQFPGLKGVPLEFEMPQGPMTIKVTASNVSTTSVSDSKFEVSTEGYTEMSPEDMMKSMGGQ